jgi:septin 4
MEEVNGHTCKVFSATNVELVTKTRTEHLSGADKKGAGEEAGAGLLASPLQTLLGMVHGAEDGARDGDDGEGNYNYRSVGAKGRM